jgi:hypothetical protein
MLNTIEQAMARADAMRERWIGDTILTPRGAAVVALIREGWLRDVAPNDREPAVYGLCVAIAGIGPDDRHYLVDLVAAHCGTERSELAACDFEAALTSLEG